MNYTQLNGVVKDSVLAELPETMQKFNISNPLRLCHFLSQCSHESGNFSAVRENMNYSAQGLVGTFPKYFPNLDLANKYARQPEKIGSRVYANRMGNGDEASQQGFLFRGRGYIQLTGKSNYADFGKFIGVDLISNPDLVATKYPLMSAAYFFNKNNIWAICDKGETDDVIKQVTLKVNGGYKGLDDRIQKFKKYKSLVLV